MSNKNVSRRDFLRASSAAAAGAAFASAFGLPLAALAQDGDWGPPRKFIWVPQALGDWDTAFQVGAKEFCDMVGWEYQRIGDPNYAVELHAAQVNNAIAAGANVIATELESLGLVPAFETAIEQGITVVITDQGIEEEAARLGLHIINQDEYNAGIINGTQAATFAQQLTGKTEGMIVLGNGNPGSTSIDKRQNGSEEGIRRYNEANGTNYTFEGYPDGSFGELTASIQNWTAKIDQYGDSLVAAIGTGAPQSIVSALQERGYSPGQIAVGSTDIPPAHQELIRQGWVQWGIDQQFYVMGFMVAAGAWVQLERGYPYLDIRTGGELVTTANLDNVAARTEIWLEKARAYGFA